MSRRVSPPRNQVQCPICSLRLPSSHIERHAATCGDVDPPEHKAPPPPHSPEVIEVSPPTSRPNAKRRRPPSPSSSSSSHPPRKQTAWDRTARPSHPTSAHAAVPPLILPSTTFDDFPLSPPALSTPLSRPPRRRISAIIPTYPPSSPVLCAGDPPTGPRRGLQIHIPSLSPPPPGSSTPSYPSYSPPSLSSLSSLASYSTFSSPFLPPLRPLPAPSTPLSTLTLLTYNVWFDDLHQAERMRALSALISSFSPHVIALQEVTATALAVLSSAPWFSHYHRSPTPPSSPYFTLLFTRFQPLSSHRIPYISQMGRDLTAAAVDVPTARGARRLVVGTSHLESLWQSKERRAQQLKQAMSTLTEMGAGRQGGGAASLVFMGDMNLKAGEGKELIAGAGYVDVYGEHWQGVAENDKAGYTMDGKINQMGPKTVRARYDRVLARLKGWEVGSIRRVGMASVREGVWISDHFGLLTELKVAA